MEMHDRPGYPRWLAVLLMLAIVAGVGVVTYNLGIAQGIAESGRVVVAPGAAAPAAAPIVVYPRHWGGGWGFGFFPFFGLLWILLIFGAMRRLLWGGRWYGRRCGYGYDYGYGGVPPAFDEWHRRAHSQQTPPTTTQL